MLHSAATRMISTGVPLLQGDHLLGWSTPHTVVMAHHYNRSAVAKSYAPWNQAFHRAVGGRSCTRPAAVAGNHVYRIGVANYFLLGAATK